MCRVAVEGDPFFIVDNREVLRAGPSFTADTAAEISAKMGQPTPWLIGADLLAGLPRWHRAADLLAVPPTILQFVVMARPGHVIDWASLPAQVRHLRDHVVKVTPLDVSSTLVRRRVAAGEPIDELVSDGVARYIRQNDLYRNN